jgi:apolipoprotein N-acyltransferase
LSVYSYNTEETKKKPEMNRYHLLALSLTGGILAGLAWTSWFSGLILLAAFVPFLLIENHITENPGRYTHGGFFLYILPGIVVFNILTVSWVRTASIQAVITVIAGMSFFMAFTLWLAHIVRIRTGIVTGSVAFISFWLTFEFLTLSLPLLSPWINLGNGLAKDIMFIQWYEATGVSGGTLWILASNLFLALLIVNLLRQDKCYKWFLRIWLAVVIIPTIISLTRFYTISRNTAENEILIVQPNIDPYTEKFKVPFEEQLNKVLKMASKNITPETKWLLTPETTVDDPVNEHYTNSNQYIIKLKDFAAQNPGIVIISGLVSYILYPPSTKPPTSSARKIDSTGFFYDHFNSAFLIDSSGVRSIYHKSKLVPGIEMQFSAGLGKIINRIVPYLGGTHWGYGIQDERTCFIHPFTGQVAAPIICYESVFGNYVADYVRKGANVLFIITNDGWWKNTSGYRQHLSYASLRAIETRRPVARAANTGISCIIDIRGKRTEQSKWWTEEVLRGYIGSGTSMTPYVKYGDYLMWIAAILCGLTLAYTFIILPLRKKITTISSK